jgi:RNA recognition motif-containing protein
VGAKVYVGNLPYSAQEEELQTLFAQAGSVLSVSVITDRYTGRSKGFAFVEMGDQSEAEKAINMFNGYSMSDRELKVSMARPREERPEGEFGGGYRDKRSPRGRNQQRGGGPRRF